MNSNIEKIISSIKTDVSGKWISTDQVEEIVNSVVDECIDIFVDRETLNDGDPAVGYYDPDEPAEIIRQHFGIESEVDDETCPKCGDTWSGTSCGIPGCGWIKGV